MNLDSGRHVAINIRTKTPRYLQNTQHIHKLFDNVISAINMNPLAPPQSFKVPALIQNVSHQTADDGGLTTFCIIDTSHVAYHSWPLQNRFRFSVDSCKDFSTSKILHVLNDFFEIEAISVIESKYRPPLPLLSAEDQIQLQSTLPFTTIKQTQEMRARN